LLLVQRTIGDFAMGRLLISPWSAFKGVFPMHGTYFAQNEVFEDETAGEARLPLSVLGEERVVHLGKSIERLLRRRTADELRQLFRTGYVCLRRFRSADGRLLPIALDPIRLLKHKATPSALALHVGLARPLEGCVKDDAAATSAGGRDDCPLLPSGLRPPTPGGGEGVGVSVLAGRNVGGAEVGGIEEMEVDELRTKEMPSTSSDAGQVVPYGAVHAAAFERGLRLFSLYRAAGGALCMRQAVWRKLASALHPDRGGDVAVFQHISLLKRQLDSGELATLPPPSKDGVDGESIDDPLYARLRAELQEAASGLDDTAAQLVNEL